MNSIQDRRDLKNLRNWIDELQQDLINIDLLLSNCTITTFPDLMIRRNKTVMKISTFEEFILIIKRDLNTLSRS